MGAGIGYCATWATLGVCRGGLKICLEVAACGLCTGRIWVSVVGEAERREGRGRSVRWLNGKNEWRVELL